MRLSRLERFVLQSVQDAGGKTDRRRFLRFYNGQDDPPSRDDQINTITKALERMIDKELLTGYGVRTPKKWYIKEVRLTPVGRRVAKRLRGEQQEFRFKT